MTADDVVWSFKRYLTPATSWRCYSELTGKGFAKIETVEAPDANTVRIKLDQPTALFLGTLARPDCGQTAILHRDSVGPDGKWVRPIGTGPFKLREWRRGQYIELDRFEEYASLGGARRLHRGQGSAGRQAPHQCHPGQFRRQGRAGERRARRHDRPCHQRHPRPQEPAGG
jgi:peptide/nickel transport system substrate-binding protein